MRAWLCRTAFLFCAGALPGSAYAVDPILMFLIGAARQALEARATASVQAAPASGAAAKNYPGTTVEPDQLRQLIDASFGYLSERQRAEVFDSLHAALMDPKNAPRRAALIEYFADRALAVRAAQLRLAQLSAREKQALATQFRQAIAELPDEERKQLFALLDNGLLPLPADLNQLLLAELSAAK